ncbi:MAG: hypothetical protein ACI8Y4_003323 [Candidatus Poriferisodalaceae bacterium]|jgi:hypothetical protein
MSSHQLASLPRPDNPNGTHVERDQTLMQGWLSSTPDTDSVASFVAGPGIERLDLSFNNDALRSALSDVTSRVAWSGDWTDHGFDTLCVTRRPGVETPTSNDLSGCYWMRTDERYAEEPFEEIVEEAAFSELVPDFEGTYFEEVVDELRRHFDIGRVRINSKGVYNCNSWHRDPEPRLHIPIITNPGSVFVVNHHCTHLPADGSVYFTDTRGYHTAFDGGPEPRVHLIAALPLPAEDGATPRNELEA